jgi:hypothetical protein
MTNGQRSGRSFSAHEPLGPLRWSRVGLVRLLVPSSLDDPGGVIVILEGWRLAWRRGGRSGRECESVDLTDAGP